MKPLLLLVVCCLGLHSASGAPASARYMFVTCNPDGSDTNCVTHQTPEMEWTPDLPAKLPASSAKNLRAEPVENEYPPSEVEEQEDIGESPMMYQPEEGSTYEGSGFDSTYYADQAFMPTENETGSGEKNEDQLKGQDKSGMKQFSRSRSLADEAQPEEQELKEDHLLQL